MVSQIRPHFMYNALTSIAMMCTLETEKAYEIIIEDDGVGFDVNEKKNDGRSHVGMGNTKKRLHDICGGEVIVTSVIGKGTTAKVILPKEGQTHENTVR